MFSFITMLLEAVVETIDHVRQRRAREYREQIDAAGKALRAELEAKAAAKAKQN